MKDHGRPRSPLRAVAGFVAVLALSLQACDTADPTQAHVPEPVIAESHGGSYTAGTDIRTPGDYDINGAKWTALFELGVGTGVIDPFLGIQASPSEHGFNTDASPLPLDSKRPQFTDALPLNNVPVITEDAAEWREFILDGNENSSGSDPQFSIDELDMWLCQDPAAPGYTDLADFESNVLCELIYDIDGDAPPGDDEAALLATTANTSGSGSNLDYRFLVPVDFFGAAANAACQYNPLAPDCGYYIVVYAHMGGLGGDYITDATFEEFSTIRRGFLTVTKTANTSLVRTWEWTIEKVADETSLELLPGDLATVNYEVEVDATSSDGDWMVTGDITIENPSNDPVGIDGVGDQIDGVIDAVVECPVTFPFELAGGGTLICTYSASLPDGTNRINRASVDLTDQATITSLEVAVDFSEAAIEEVDECIDVTDDNVGSLGTVCAADGLPLTFNYSLDFGLHPDADVQLECGDNSHPNIASFVAVDDENDTGQNDQDDWNVDATVTCALVVTKDAATSLTRSWDWTIDKSADQTNLLLSDGQIFQVNYTVEVDLAGPPVDNDWAVEGTITITNPTTNGGPATIESVSDMVDGIAATVDCGVTFPHELAAGATLECGYQVDLPSDATLTNTATVLTSGDIDGDEGTAEVSFAGAEVTEVDECIEVTDDNVGFLGTVCADDPLPASFQYSLDFGSHPDADIVLVCGDNQHDNTATYVVVDDENDTGETDSDDWTVTALVECVIGCTLTPGYWKTHSEYGPAPYDETWAELPNGADTPFFLSGQTWYEVFWTPPRGNAYYNLAHHYMAAVLNGLNDADQSAVAQALADAQTLFNTYTPAEVGAWRGRQGERGLFIELAGILADYNEGVIGPGHCDEDENSA